MWEVKVRRVTSVAPLENSDFLDLTMIGGWPTVTRRGEFKPDQLVVYIPQESIVPNDLLEKMGLVGKLSGPQKNRVKAVRLRGQLSIGLVIAAPEGTVENQDVSELLGITRWEMPVPVQLRGKVRAHPRGWVKYDIDNINDNPDTIQEGEEIVFTEKLHGTASSFGLVNGEFVVNSRNITLLEEENNLYWQIARQYNIESLLRLFYTDKTFDIWLHGEIFGPVQDLQYGLTKPELRLYDIRKVDHFTGNITWYDVDDFVNVCNALMLPRVPILYRGPFSQQLLKEYTSGPETISGKKLHMREGLVARPIIERVDKRGNRVILKSVSPEYMLRKNGTEYH